MVSFLESVVFWAYDCFLGALGLDYKILVLSDVKGEAQISTLKQMLSAFVCYSCPTKKGCPVAGSAVTLCYAKPCSGLQCHKFSVYV
jgi:hypothetical protein